MTGTGGNSVVQLVVFIPGDQRYALRLPAVDRLPPRDFALSARLLIARTARRALAVRVHEVLGVRKVSEEVVLGRKRSCPTSGAWRASPPSRRALC